MSHAMRHLRLAKRVAQARLPKRLAASTRLALQPVAPPPEANSVGELPMVTLAPEWQQPRGSAPPLPVSEEAARWLTQGEIPSDLVPLLGDPRMPVPKSAATEQRPPEQAPLRGELEQGAGTGQVVARIIEGAPPPFAEPSGQTPGDGAPLMRLARAPAPRELAQGSGGEISEDGMGMSTVTFKPAPASASPPTSPAKPGPSPAKPGPRRRKVGLASQTPIAPALREQLGDIDVDELYEGFLHRLRRDLLHDRERVGDLLGPLR